MQLFPQIPSSVVLSLERSALPGSRYGRPGNHPSTLLASFQPPATATLSLSISRKPGMAALFTVGLNDGTSIPSAFQYHSTEVILVSFSRLTRNSVRR